MTKLYNEADAATNKNASAYIVLDHNRRCVAKVTLKYTDQRCTAYLWIEGSGISKGIANGGGYDRASAAVRKAAQKMPPCQHAGIVGYDDRRATIIALLDIDDGMRWMDRLYNQRFEVIGTL